MGGTCFIHNLDAPRSFMDAVRSRVQQAGWRVVTDPSSPHEASIFLGEATSGRSSTYGPHRPDGGTPKLNLWVGRQGELPHGWGARVGQLLRGEYDDAQPRPATSLPTPTGVVTSSRPWVPAAAGTCRIHNLDAPESFLHTVRSRVGTAGWRVVTDSSASHDVAIVLGRAASGRSSTHGPYRPKNGVPTLNLWVGRSGEVPGGWQARVDELLETHGRRSGKLTFTPKPRFPLAPSTTTPPSATTQPSVTTRPVFDPSRLIAARRSFPQGYPPSTTSAADRAARHVFISYSKEDQKYVDKLVKRLEKAGVDCWIDKSGIDYGDEYPKAIEHALSTSAAVVVVMTPAAWTSRWVGLEIERALEDGKPILPLLLDGRKFMTLGTTQYESVVGGKMPPKRWVEQVQHLVAEP